MIDAADGQIVHALQIAPRASFRRIAAVIGVDEQTVTRRYRALRRDGVLRVIGVVNPWVYGECRWIVRLRAKPDDLVRLAEALVRRPEVTHANVLSGGAELVCVVRAPIDHSGDGLLNRLPRTSAIVDLRITLILRDFGSSADAQWTGHGHGLDEDRIAALQAVESVAPARPVAPTAEDQPMLDALAEDGRVSESALARRIGWSPARVKRRLAALQASGTLSFDLDLLPEGLGFTMNAIIWITIAPRHLATVAETVARHAEVASVAAVSGPANLMAIVICRDTEHLYDYIAERLAGVDGISSYEVTIRTKRLKQAGSLISHGRLVGA